VLSIMSAVQMKKSASKRVPKTHTLQQASDEEWDTLKARFLQKISLSLNPTTIDFGDYTILFHIPRVIAKPGIPLTTSQEYAFLIGQAVKMKMPMVNLSIMENKRDGDSDKENSDEDDNDNEAGKSKKKVHICVSVSMHYNR